MTLKAIKTTEDVLNPRVVGRMIKRVLLYNDLPMDVKIGWELDDGFMYGVGFEEGFAYSEDTWESGYMTFWRLEVE